MANRGHCWPCQAWQCLTSPSTAGPRLQGVGTLWGCGLHGSSLLSALSVWKNTNPQIFLPTCFHEFPLKAYFLRELSFIYLRCASHRLHLFLRIVPMDKGREGTKPASDSRMVFKH